MVGRIVMCEVRNFTGWLNVPPLRVFCTHGIEKATHKRKKKRYWFPIKKSESGAVFDVAVPLVTSTWSICPRKLENKNLMNGVLLMRKLKR